MANSANVYLEFLDRYGAAAGETAPVAFCREVLGVEPDPWQERVLLAYGRGERRISIRACHGPGKTAVAAWLVVYQLLTRYPQKTVATAPSKAQLEDALVAEILAWMRKLPPLLLDLFELKQLRIELKAAPEESFFSARTARAETPEALQGVHSEHVLLIADEASGVPEAIFEAAAGSMSGLSATTLLLSNPVRASGFFFDTHHKLSDMWFTVHVSHEDSPRVSDDFVRDIGRRYGENSNAYRVRALGEFPLGEADKVVAWGDIESARERDIESPPGMTEVWGLDVARFGSDSCALVRRNKLEVLPEILTWTGRDTMETAGRVKALWDATPSKLRPETILVDVIGIGSGVVDRLRELGLPVRGVNVSETGTVDDRYRNLRTQLWFQVAEWLGNKDRKLPQHCTCETCQRNPNDDHAEQLARELASVGFGYTSTGKLAVEPKDETKKTLGYSPDIADALVLTFAAEPSTLVYGLRGASWNRPWTEPVHRNRAVV